MKNEMKKYNCFEDSGHGWLEVDRGELLQSGIAEKISSCSYQKDKWVYLEEDMDKWTFLDAKFNGDIEKAHASIKTNYVNGSSIIRTYAPFELDRGQQESEK